MLQKISTDKAPAAIGPYSQGIIVGNILFASGQIPINPATGEIEEYWCNSFRGRHRLYTCGKNHMLPCRYE